jgi:hypothetical protein
LGFPARLTAGCSTVERPQNEREKIGRDGSPKLLRAVSLRPSHRTKGEVRPSAHRRWSPSVSSRVDHVRLHPPLAGTTERSKSCQVVRERPPHVEEVGSGPRNRTLIRRFRDYCPAVGRDRNEHCRFVGGTGIEPASIALRGRCVTLMPTSHGWSGTHENRTRTVGLKRPTLYLRANVPRFLLAP